MAARCTVCCLEFSPFPFEAKTWGSHLLKNFCISLNVPSLSCWCGDEDEVVTLPFCPKCHTKVSIMQAYKNLIEDVTSKFNSARNDIALSVVESFGKETTTSPVAQIRQHIYETWKLTYEEKQKKEKVGADIGLKCLATEPGSKATRTAHDLAKQALACSIKGPAKGAKKLISKLPIPILTPFTRKGTDGKFQASSAPYEAISFFNRTLTSVRQPVSVPRVIFAGSAVGRAHGVKTTAQHRVPSHIVLPRQRNPPAKRVSMSADKHPIANKGRMSIPASQPTHAPKCAPTKRKFPVGPGSHVVQRPRKVTRLSEGVGSFQPMESVSESISGPHFGGPSTSALRAPMGSVSSSSSSRTVASGVFRCESCPGKVFRRLRDLRRHSSVLHSADQEFKCEFHPCKKGFAVESSYKRHLQQAHLRTSKGDTIMVCPECEKAYVLPGRFMTHLGVHNMSDAEVGTVGGKFLLAVDVNEEPAGVSEELPMDPLTPTDDGDDDGGDSDLNTTYTLLSGTGGEKVKVFPNE